MAKKKEKELPNLETTLLPAEEGDVIELDEIWSYVGSKANAIWAWIAFCKRTRQIVAWVLGKRSYTCCNALWRVIPQSYKKCKFFSDKLNAYRYCFSKKQLKQVCKEARLTNHVERWNNTLRQRVSRYVRKTLSLSKLDEAHSRVLKIFIHTYNIRDIMRN